METPSGRMITKKGYWLNAEYIWDVIKANMKIEEEQKKTHFISQDEYN